MILGRYHDIIQDIMISTFDSDAPPYRLTFEELFSLYFRTFPALSSQNCPSENTTN